MLNLIKTPDGHSLGCIPKTDQEGSNHTRWGSQAQGSEVQVVRLRPKKNINLGSMLPNAGQPSVRVFECESRILGLVHSGDSGAL